MIKAKAMNNMVAAVRSVLGNYATFSGRTTRSVFWWWALATLLLLIVTRLIDGAVISPMLGFDPFQAEGGQPLSLLVSLTLLLPSVAVAARRLHDIGQSAWWLLIAFVPIVGALVLLYFYVKKSDGENTYGAPTAS